MTPLSIVFWLLGISLVAFGYREARGPWARYRALKAQDANVARYESWRGGARDSSTTGASVAMELLRRQARHGAIVMAVGVLMILLGFLVR